MRFTFLLLVLGFIALSLVLDFFVLKTQVICTKYVLRVAGMLMVVTLVFDNVLTALPVYSFNEPRTLGIFLPKAPIEDLFYIVAVVFFVAVLDKYFHTRSV